MLFGSRSAALLPAPAPPPGVPLMPAVPAPVVVAPGEVDGVVAAGAPSSTGAASCVGLLAQPASAATTNAPMIHLRMGFLLELNGVTAGAGPRQVRAHRPLVRR